MLLLGFVGLGSPTDTTRFIRMGDLVAKPLWSVVPGANNLRVIHVSTTKAASDMGDGIMMRVWHTVDPVRMHSRVEHVWLGHRSTKQNAAFILELVIVIYFFSALQIPMHGTRRA